MSQVHVDLAGRSYTIACRDGDEPHLMALAADLGRRADALLDQLGPMPEGKLMLMVALTVADQLHEYQSGAAAAVEPPALDPALHAWLGALATRIETLADKLAA